MVTCPKCLCQFEVKKSTYTEEFLSFWKAYEIKSKCPNASKPDAFKAWNQISRPNTDALLIAVRGYFGYISKTNGIVCHPSTFLRQARFEEFLPPGSSTDSSSGLVSSGGLVTSSVVSAPPPSVHVSWEKLGPLISHEIGEAKFKQWFAGTELIITPNNPAMITVPTALKRDWVTKSFAFALYKVLGEFEVVLKRETPEKP